VLIRVFDDEAGHSQSLDFLRALARLRGRGHVLCPNSKMEPFALSIGVPVNHRPAVILNHYLSTPMPHKGPQCKRAN
jgi:hypothetical protein